MSLVFDWLTHYLFLAEYDYVHSPEGQMKLVKESTEGVTTETNGAHELRAIDQLPTEEVLVETTVA